MKTKFLLIILALVAVFPCFAQSPEHSKPEIWEIGALGRQPALERVDLFGINGSIPATLETVWQESAVYTPLSTAMSTPYCASASTDDDGSPVGTGARTITVKGLNTSFAPFTETVTMDGQTSVNLATANVLIINSLEVATAGSTGGNAGIIQCGTGTNTAGDPAVTHAYLAVMSGTVVAGSGNKSQSFIYGVAAGKTLLCHNIAAGSVFATAASGIQVAIDGFTNLGIRKRFFSAHIQNTGANPYVSHGHIAFPEKTIIVGAMAGPTGSNTGPVNLRAECLLVDNTYQF